MSLIYVDVMYITQMDMGCCDMLTHVLIFSIITLVLIWQGCNLIRNTRRDMYGDDKFKAIEMKYGSGTKTENFLMFSIFWSDEDGPQRILGFSLHPLIKLLKYKKLFLHVDATFDGAPRGFYQVVIFSVMDHASSMHTPVFYCPMTKKTEEAYNLLWSHIVSIVGEFSNMQCFSQTKDIR
jgi:hypothetical protein